MFNKPVTTVTTSLDALDCLTYRLEPRMIDPLPRIRNHTDRQTDISNILKYTYVHTDKYTWLAIPESIVIYTYTYIYMLHILLHIL